MNILVLGGDGFLGSHFVDKALALGHDVTVFDRFENNASRNLEHLRGKARFIQGDFSDRDILRKALEDKNIIYHFISSTNPAQSWLDPYAEIDNNLTNSIRLFELAAASGARKIVFSSSGGTVYGPREGLIKEEDLPSPFSPYGITKLATEYFLNYAAKRWGLAWDAYRTANAYGPRQPLKGAQGVIAVWMGDILQGRGIQVYGGKETIRDYVYAEDIAFLMTHSLNDLSSSDVYNLGTGRGVSISELLDIFKDAIDTPFKYEVHSKRESDNASVILDSTKLTSFFPGFKFQYLEDKLHDTWEFVRSSRHGS